MIFNVGDKVKLTFDYIRRNKLSDEAKNLEFVLLDFPCDMWYPYRAKLIGRKNKNEYPHIWYFRDDDIEYADDYITPETIRYVTKHGNGYTPRFPPSFMKKVVDFVHGGFIVALSKIKRK